MPHSNTQHQERLAVILNRAISDESFAAQLHMNPTNAGKDLDLTLRIDEVVALKGLDLAQLAAASKALRSPLAGRATFDQQQVRTD
ncbi:MULTISPECIES: Os1348 family NHLP clan protein [unclassified Pseudomonas]|uniref:Os1348 family NHLP clan protein n=1 Tax=unclassified Pseudomonas TaxID=196821 RepID=UPI0012FD0345|nr:MULTISPECIES: Os1348 family NHLP clan protein [unclassified Pseudomonas]MCU1738243.1 Os1348 family NHLP clan protein [Pseudomonas sp. 20S_6.2_Bac1]